MRRKMKEEEEDKEKGVVLDADVKTNWRCRTRRGRRIQI